MSPPETAGQPADAKGPKGPPSMLADESEPVMSPAAAMETRVLKDVYAMGDVCANPDKLLPALAQVRCIFQTVPT